MLPESTLVARWLGTVPAGRAAEQRVRFQREHWDDDLAESPLAGLYLPLADSFDSGIPRQALYDLADQEQWTALHLWCLIWGYGSRGGLGNLKRSAVVEEVQAADPEVLESVATSARSSARDGYLALWKETNTPSIRGLRVSMGTKLLHFSGHGHAAPGPLIYDKRVWGSLAAAGVDWPHPTSGDIVKADDYVRYVTAAAEVADEFGCSAADVECELFLRQGRA